jgi:N-acetylglucosamine-6-phosphate deacetylase
MLLLAGGRVVTPDGVLDPGWIRLAGAVIDEVGAGNPPARPPDVDLRGQWVLPGFIDVHAHGGGGASFTEGAVDQAGSAAAFSEGAAEQARQAATFHRARGSTTLLASLVTAPVAELEARAAMLAGLADAGLIAGLHLEGPFLSPARRGAQDPRYMIPPDVAVFERLHAAARGHLKIITLAPELPGALALIHAATRAGVTVAVGHTDATAEVTMAAVDAGATHATHLFNGMRPLHHREPGAVGALLDRAEVTCEVIADGVHLDDIAVRLTARAAGPGRLVLVSDAMAAAGMPDGSYQLGSQQVTVTGGVARLLTDPAHAAASAQTTASAHAAASAHASASSHAPASTQAAASAGPGAIAGSTATLADVVRHAIAAGLPVPAVAAAASTTPARVLGLAGRTGALRPGLAADLVVCDDDFRPRAVMRHGQWLTQPANS